MDGSRRETLRSADVARASGYSVQQVRDLERLGVLPPAARSGNGYRAYTPLHVRALRAYRGLAEATGPVEARRLLAGLRTATVPEAAAAVGAVHVRLAAEREEVLRALRALRAIEAEGGAPDRPADGDDALTITELAGALGVRASTLRFWEEEGLLAPERVTSLRARRYGPSAVAAARVVAALRSAGYGIPAVREAVTALHGSSEGGGTAGTAESARVLSERLDLLAARTVALLRAGADLAAVVAEAGGETSPGPS